MCFSLGEKTIDDLLYSRSIRHEKEVPYPEGGFRADFEVSGDFVEYFGLKGDPEYDAKTETKRRLCRKRGIKLIAVYPRDLASRKKLEAKLAEVLPIRSEAQHKGE